MGIDAEMFVRVKRAVPDDEVRRLRLQLGSAFGADKFWIFGRDKAVGEAPLDEADDDHAPIGSPRHCIERVTEFRQDGDALMPEPGETFLRVYIASRFYGDGYERGNLPLILAVAAFLREATHGEVWYGGDSSGVCAELLDDARRRELWAHFVAVQHEPYENGMRWDRDDNIPNQHCTFCNAPMRRYGGGSGGLYAPFFCCGCGADIETRDGGKTWAPRKNGAP
jgi:hypothetical protein